MNDRKDSPPDAHYTNRQGGSAIGARLRRLSERIDGDAARLYADSGVAFEQRWFGVLNLLSRFGPMSVGELAGPLGISHASVSETRKSLLRAGLIAATPDPLDARSRKLALTDEGRGLMTRMAPLMEALIAVADELDEEAGAVVAALERLDQALDSASVYDRVRQRLTAGETADSG
ncbi:MAG: MarR family transcriptional regulator [Caulobacter sp.]|jgi:DNA-binding MarR family transcriptional regulator|nr:MarR family transcriptional regulator [Caulobacter sp.]